MLTNGLLIVLRALIFKKVFLNNSGVKNKRDIKKFHTKIKKKENQD